MRTGWSALATSNSNDVVRHGIEPSVNHFVVHRKHKHVVKETLQQLLHGGAVFAIHVARFARRRGVRLRGERWTAQDHGAVWTQGFDGVADKDVFVPG